MCLCVRVCLLCCFFKFSSQCCVLFLEVKASQQSGDMTPATYYTDRQKLQPAVLSFRSLWAPLSTFLCERPPAKNNLSFPNSPKLLAFGQVKPRLRGEAWILNYSRTLRILGEAVGPSGPALALIQRSETERQSQAGSISRLRLIVRVP